MTLETRAVLQNLLDASDEEKQEYGSEGYNLLTMYLSQVGIEGKDFDDFILEITKLFVSADRSCHIKELFYFEHVTNKTYAPKEFYNITNGGADPSFVRYMLLKLYKFDKYPLGYLLQYVAGLIASDEEISTKELKLYDTIMQIYEMKEE